MFSIVPVLDDLVSHASHPVFGRGLSLMDDFKANLGFSNEVKTIEDSKKQLVLGVNCESFKPEEIKVAIKDNMLEISGNHEEKSDHSYVKRQFSRKFALPSNSIQEKMNFAQQFWCTQDLNSKGRIKGCWWRTSQHPNSVPQVSVHLSRSCFVDFVDVSAIG